MSEVKESTDIEKIKAKVNKLKKKYGQNVGNNVRKNVRNNDTAKKSIFNKIRTKVNSTLNKPNTTNKVKKFTNAQKNRDNYIHELINLQYTYKYIDVFNKINKTSLPYEQIKENLKDLFKETESNLQKFTKYNNNEFIHKFM